MHTRATLDELMENTVLSPNGCMLWLGSTSGEPKKGETGRGYPRVKWGGQMHAVHRLVVKLSGAKLAPHEEVDHACRTRLCIRYTAGHLEKVTKKENTRRRDKAQRRMKRERLRDEHVNA